MTSCRRSDWKYSIDLHAEYILNVVLRFQAPQLQQCCINNSELWLRMATVWSTEHIQRTYSENIFRDNLILIVCTTESLELTLSTAQLTSLRENRLSTIQSLHMASQIPSWNRNGKRWSCQLCEPPQDLMNHLLQSYIQPTSVYSNLGLDTGPDSGVK